MGETFDEAMMLPGFAKFIVRTDEPVEGITRSFVAGNVIGKELGTGYGAWESIDASVIIVPRKRYYSVAPMVGYCIQDLLDQAVLAQPHFWHEVDLHGKNDTAAKLQSELLATMPAPEEG